AQIWTRAAPCLYALQSALLVAPAPPGAAGQAVRATSPWTGRYAQSRARLADFRGKADNQNASEEPAAQRARVRALKLCGQAGAAASGLLLRTTAAIGFIHELPGHGASPPRGVGRRRSNWRDCFAGSLLAPHIRASARGLPRSSDRTGFRGGGDQGHGRQHGTDL